LDQTDDEIDDTREKSLSDHRDLDQTDDETDDTRGKSSSVMAVERREVMKEKAAKNIQIHSLKFLLYK